jgi:hypothetical protein
MAVDTDLAGSASGAVVFSQFFWPAALQQFTGPLVDGTCDGDGALCPSDRSTARRVDGGMGKGLVLLVELTRPISRYSSVLLPGSLGNPEKSIQTERQDRALTLNTW